MVGKFGESCGKVVGMCEICVDLGGMVIKWRQIRKAWTAGKAGKCGEVWEVWGMGGKSGKTGEKGENE
jgi:hypothetical protein